ncbi:MAG: hypothetical protein JW864_14665 [Spirochaetes bacterium]|nr:hypothetical protein [Spirochaetota bacterium]
MRSETGELQLGKKIEPRENEVVDGFTGFTFIFKADFLKSNMNKFQEIIKESTISYNESEIPFEKVTIVISGFSTGL